MSRRLRYSYFAVTLNTHRQWSQRLQDDVLQLLRTFNDKQVVARLWSLESPDVLERTVVEDDEVGMELTTKQRHFHVHFTWTLLHSTTLNMGRAHIQRAIQDYVREQLSVKAYCHVSIIADRSRAANYNLKQLATDAHSAEALEGRVFTDRSITFNE